MGAYFHSQFKVGLSKILIIFLSWNFSVYQPFLCGCTFLSHEFIVPFSDYFRVTLINIFLIGLCSLYRYFYIILTVGSSLVLSLPYVAVQSYSLGIVSLHLISALASYCEYQVQTGQIITTGKNWISALTPLLLLGQNWL